MFNPYPISTTLTSFTTSIDLCIIFSSLMTFLLSIIILYTNMEVNVQLGFMVKGTGELEA